MRAQLSRPSAHTLRRVCLPITEIEGKNETNYENCNSSLACHGRARREAKDLAGAADAFEKCGDDARARFWAACCRGDPSEDAPIEHLEALYDGYAGRYDAHLSETLASRAPALVAESVRGTKAARALDCGCGTGLSGRALFDAEACSKLDGVDLSEAMCEKARATGLYEDVAKGELCPCAGVRISHTKPPNDRNVRRAD